MLRVSGVYTRRELAEAEQKRRLSGFDRFLKRDYEILEEWVKEKKDD